MLLSESEWRLIRAALSRLLIFEISQLRRIDRGRGVSAPADQDRRIADVRRLRDRVHGSLMVRRADVVMVPREVLARVGGK